MNTRNGRSDGIRTHGLLVPNQAHYQTVPHPDAVSWNKWKYSIDKKKKQVPNQKKFVFYPQLFFPSAGRVLLIPEAQARPKTTDPRRGVRGGDRGSPTADRGSHLLPDIGEAVEGLVEGLVFFGEMEAGEVIDGLLKET